MTEETTELYTQRVDGIISAKLPDHNQDQALYELVKTHQLHNTQKHVENIKTLNLDFLLVDFLVRKL